MKRNIICSILALAAWISASMCVQAQATTNSPTIKGGGEINFYSRTALGPDGRPKPGVSNVYTLDLTHSDGVRFHGKVVHMPTLFSATVGREIQKGYLNYDIGCTLVNPANPKQTRSVGRITGTVPIDSSGVYRFSDGNLRMGISAIGRAQAFTKQFTGVAEGIPPKRDSYASKKWDQAITIKRSVSGNALALVVTNYDKMIFKGHVLPQGPAEIYSDVQIDGDAIYDDALKTWMFYNMTLDNLNDREKPERLSGSIQWVEEKRQGNSRDGQYEFDVRVNEPEIKSTVATAFVPASGISAFFDSDPNLASLVGTVKYKDTFSGDTVTKSELTIDLTGQKLTGPQTMALEKLIFFSMIVPFNNE